MKIYTQDKIIKNKLELLKLAKKLDNLSRACKIKEIIRKKPNLKNRVPIEKAVVKYAKEYPAHAQIRYSNE